MSTTSKTFTLTTECQGDDWHATILDGEGRPLINRDGDTESEAVCIAAVEYFGDLPTDFPYGKE